MGETRPRCGVTFVIGMALLAGCLPRPEPAEPQQPASAQPYPQPQPQPQPSTVSGPPQPAPQPSPYAPPSPYAQPYPQPSPYPQPQPSPYGYAGAPPYTPPPPPPPTRSHLHDGEVIADFAAVGTLAAVDILVRQDVNSQAGTFILLGGVVGGGAVGYLLADRFPVDGGAAHATTLGLLLGVANGALLVEPTGYTHGSSIMGLLVAGSAVGAGGGFLYGQSAHLTGGQSTFVGTMTLLGSATAALGAITGSRDGKFGGWEDGTLALGLDGGAVTGAIIAPSLDWSAHRSNLVLASTAIGALVGGMAASLITKPNSSTDANGDIVAAAMTAGLWGGFALGIMTTKDAPPDSHFKSHDRAQAAGAPAVLPMVGAQGQLGVMTAGMF